MDVRVTAMRLRSSTGRFLQPWFWRATQYVSSRRSSQGFRYLARLSWLYLAFYDNVSNVMERNGELRVLEVSVGRRGCVFDVGANVGDYTAEALSRTGVEEVHCFEIIPETAERLRTRFAGTRRVQVNSFGLADENATVSVRYYPEFSDCSSISGYEHSLREEESEWLECSVRRGDDYCRDHDITRIDLLKVDAEGSDLEVIGGFSNMLAENQIRVIQFEFGRASVYNGTPMRAFAEILEGHGYTIGKVLPASVEFRPYTHWLEDLRGTNYVAVAANETSLIGQLAGAPAPDLLLEGWPL